MAGGRFKGFVERSYWFADLVLMVAPLVFAPVLFMLVWPRLEAGQTAGQTDGLAYVLATKPDSKDALYLESEPVVSCEDHSTDPPERRWVYEQIDQALVAAGWSTIPRDIRIDDDFAIADPDTYWTVYVGGACGEPVIVDAGSMFSVHRTTGDVSDGVWVVAAYGLAGPYWIRENGRWERRAPYQLK